MGRGRFEERACQKVLLGCAPRFSYAAGHSPVRQQLEPFCTLFFI